MSHCDCEMSFAHDVANHVIFMDGGHIIEENPPQEFFTSPKEERTKQFLSTFCRIPAISRI